MLVHFSVLTPVISMLSRLAQRQDLLGLTILSRQMQLNKIVIVLMRQKGLVASNFYGVLFKSEASATCLYMAYTKVLDWDTYVVRCT